MDTTEMRRRYRRFADEAWGRGDLAVVDELIAPEIVHHGAGPQPAPGPEGTAEWIRQVRAGIPDLVATIEHEAVDGDVLVDHLVVRGTHTGELLGVPGSGDAVEFELVDLNRFDGSGRIVEHWSVMDTRGLLQEAVAVPRERGLAGVVPG